MAARPRAPIAARAYATGARRKPHEPGCECGCEECAGKSAGKSARKGPLAARVRLRAITRKPNKGD